MRNKFLSFLLLVMVMASSCTKEDAIQQMTSLSGGKFVATFEQNDSRTYLEDGKYLRWTAGDELSIFMGKTLNRQFRFTGETGDNSGGFEEASSPGFVTGNDLDNPCHYAIYPYTKATKITETGVLTVNLPSEQTYAENSFGCGANTMVAVTSSLSDMELSFKNVCGYLRFKLYGDDVTVKSVTLQSKGEEKLSGSATLTAANDKNPSITMSSTASDMITLDCGTGVKIGSTAETATAIWFVVPPTTFESGFTITIKDVNDNEFTKSTSKKISIERNVIKPISAFEVQPQIQTKEIPYLTFTADAEQTLTMSTAVETLEYSVNNGEWETLGTTTVTFGDENGDLKLRGRSDTGTAGRLSYSTIKFGNNTNVTCSGDIRTLIDYENHKTCKTENANFTRLFYNCTNLITPPELPATTLSKGCYLGMFEGCENLNEVPELPAINLTEECYRRMFMNCKKINSTPALPATTLANSCYEAMFEGCDNLTSLTELPATILAERCYMEMFANCKKITTAPELSATILAESCYNSMFWGCENLTSTPLLPATTLAKFCYSHMFYACSNLTTVSNLPAITLELECYRGMFKYCKNIIKTPQLPAKELVPYCYYEMFSGCLKLNIVIMTATDISASYCLGNWLSNVSSSGTFIKAKSMTMLPEGNSGIPKGWTVKDYE